MYEKINYLWVGLFVTLFTALAFYFAFWLAKEDMSSSSYNIYRVYFEESVDGLNKDSVVKLNGVDVGRVKNIGIDSSKPFMVIVEVYIEKDIKITKDMRAVLQGQGLTGLRYINIIGGRVKEYILPNRADSVIASKVSFLSKLTEQAPELMDRVSQIFNEKNINNVDKILSNSADLTKKAIAIESSLQKLIGESNATEEFTINKFLSSLKDLNSTIVEYKKLAQSGQNTLKIANKKLPDLLDNINKSAKRLKVAANHVSRSINRGDYNLKRILTPAVNDLRVLASEYKELGDEIEALVQNPTGSLFNGKSISKGPGE